MPTSNLPAVLKIRSQLNPRPPPVLHLQHSAQTGTLDPLLDLQHTAYHVVLGYEFGHKMLNSRFTRQALRLYLEKKTCHRYLALTENDL